MPSPARRRCSRCSAARLTTHRRIAEEVVDRLARFRKVLPPWTAEASLPGGNFPAEQGASHLCLALRAAYPFLERGHRPSPGHHLRHPRLDHPHRGARIRRSRSLLRRRSHGGGGRLSAARRMGDDGGGRAVAAHAPRPAFHAGRRPTRWPTGWARARARLRPERRARSRSPFRRRNPVLRDRPSWPRCAGS